MKKMLINLILSFLLTGCYPCRFLDWNCNNHDSKWHRDSRKCINEQVSIAKKILEYKFDRKLHIYIINQCIDNSDYNFKNDDNYLNL